MTTTTSKQFLVLMLLACIGLGWFALKMRQARKQREAVIAIILEGGYVQQWSQEFAPLPQGTAVPTQDSVVPFSKKALEIERALGYGPPPPSYAKESRAHAWLRRWLGDDFFSHPVRAYVKNDAGAEHLEGLPQLKTLFVWGPQITDAGLANLRWIPQLEALTLSGDQITDAGLANLKWLPQLKSLSVEGRRITDASVEHLKGLSQLTELRFEHTQVSDNGVMELKQALPKCKISR